MYYLLFFNPSIAITQPLDAMSFMRSNQILNRAGRSRFTYSYSDRHQDFGSTLTETESV